MLNIIKFFLGAVLFCNSYDNAIASVSPIKFSQYIKKTITEWHLPGMAIAIIENGKITMRAAYGTTRNDQNTPLNIHTIFKIASLSKTFSGSLAAKLAQEGYISLEDKVVKHITDLKHKKWNNITIKHILSHSSGFKEYAVGKYLFNQKTETYDPYPHLTTSQIVCKPGMCYQYQNYIYSLIKRIAENATGKTYDILIKEKIFKPLGMYNTYLTDQDWHQQINKAYGHQWVKGEFIPFKSPKYYDVILPAGGMSSSIYDMSQWLKVNLGLSNKELYNTLKITHKKIITTPKEIKKSNNEWRVARLRKAHYGIGWRIYDYAGETLIFHSGMVKGFTSVICFLPRYKTGIVILANSVTGVTTAVAAKYLDLYLGLSNNDWSNMILQRVLDSLKQSNAT